MTFEIEQNDDGTYRVTVDYSLWHSNATLGESIAAVIDNLKTEEGVK